MIKIILISGFLGAGKTTLMNKMIKKMEKVAIVINEYGQTSIDDKLLETEFSVSEISNGSIFCTCRSDQFVKVLLKAREYAVDTIIVENSGLADPMGMSSIMEIIDKLSPDTFEYAGSICVVDALNFHKIKQILPVISNQITGSNLIVVNKSDLVTRDNLEVLKLELTAQGHEVITTSYCEVDDLLDKLKFYELPLSNLITKTLGISKLHLETKNKSYEEIKQWLSKIAHLTLRIKGFIKDENIYLVQSVLENYILEEWYKDEALALEVIYRSNDQCKKYILEEWNRV